MEKVFLKLQPLCYHLFAIVIMCKYKQIKFLRSKSIIIWTIQCYNSTFFIIQTMEQGSKAKLTQNQFKKHFKLTDEFMVKILTSLPYLINTCITKAHKCCCYAVMLRSKQHIWNNCLRPTCDLVSYSFPSQTDTRNCRLPVQSVGCWGRERLYTTSYTRASWPTTKRLGTRNEIFAQLQINTRKSASEAPLTT